MNLMQLVPVAVVLSIACVVIFTEIVKKLDTKDRFKRYRVWLPALFSLGFAALLRAGTFIEPGQVWFYWAVIFAVAVFGYEAVLKKVKDSLANL